jgi:dynein heavy chain
VVAIMKYHDVAKNVEPLKNKVRDLEKQAAESEAELAVIMATLAELNAQLEELNKNFSAANEELTSLRSEAQLMEKRLMAASKLIAGLGSEKVRWSNDIERLQEQTEQLVGDCVLGSSFLSYLGVFTFKYRECLLKELWCADLVEKQVPLSDSFSVENLLTTDVETQRWTGEGLPSDNHSIQNGIITTNASRFPLCIDPQQQAVRWIKKREEANNLTVKTFNDPDFMKHLELAIQFGNPFLFENLDEELDPMIDPVLEKNTFVQAGQQMIVLGDKTVDWDPTFRLYMTTKLANPHYTPEVLGKTMIVNYSVTVQGLADQLLNVVVGHERKDIEERFAMIVSEMSANGQALAALEDSLLQTLATSQGNILDNVELIQTLDEAKTKAVDIHAQIESASFTKEEIQTARKQYTPVAWRGSILFFAMAGLSAIMKMYETSLSSFLTVFKKSLDDAKKDVILEQRLENMIEEATRQIYDYTCTGIFEKHKLMFSMQMTLMIMDGDGKLNRDEVCMC